jgi:hypothetical protein
MKLSLRCYLLLVCGAAAVGCAGGQKGGGINERQDQALNDPMHYSPDFDKTDISGGGIGELDREGLRRDLNHVLDP